MATPQKKNNWLTKAVAVGVAVTLWFYASNEEDPMLKNTFDVPISYVNVADDKVILDSPQTVKVTVKGRQSDLNSLRADDFHASVDLTAAGDEGNYKIQISAPDKADRVTLSNNDAHVVIGQMSSGTLPISLKAIGEVGEEFVVEELSIEPEKVKVEGLDGAVSALSALDTVDFDLSMITQSGDYVVPLIVPEGVSVAQKYVTVHVELTVKEQEQPNTDAVVDVYIGHRNLQEGLTVRLDPVKVLVNNPDQLNVTEHPIELYVDCKGLTAGEYDLNLQMEADDAWQDLFLFDSTVHVTLTDASVQEPSADGQEEHSAE